MTPSAPIRTPIVPVDRAQAPLMLSAGGPSTIAARLGQSGLFPGEAVRWGSETAYATILHRQPPLIVLDAPAADIALMTRLVQAASLIAPVAVLSSHATHTVAALNAGAWDAIDPQAQTVDLAWRANLRRCHPAPPVPAYSKGPASQRLLFDVLARARTATCCHKLSLLLGTPAMPSGLRAFKARIHRLLPAFDQQRLTSVVDHQWGLATYCMRMAIGEGGSYADIRCGT